MYEKKEYNNHIENNKSRLKIVSDLDSSEPEFDYKSISKNYSIEETLDSKNLNININGIDINTLKSIRLSQAFGNKDLNPEILLDGMAGIKYSNQNTKPDSFNNTNDKYENNSKKNKKEIDFLKALYNKSNKKNVKTEKNSNYKEGEQIIYIKEYENNDNSDRSSQENEKKNFNFEDFVRYRNNNKLLKQQNELFIEILDSNRDCKKYNKKNRNIIISNLNEDLNYYTLDQNAKADLENNKNNINTKKFKNKIKNLPINKTSVINKKSKKYSINERIYETTNNKKINKLVNNNNNGMNKTNNNSLKIKNCKMINYNNNKSIKHLNNNKESKSKLSKNGDSYKKINKINIKKKASINIIPSIIINTKSNFKRNKSVKSFMNKNNLSTNSNKDYKIIKKIVKNVEPINYKQKEKKTVEDSFKKYIPSEYKKYCINRNLSRRNIDNNHNLTYRNIKKNNMNNANIEKSNEYHKNIMNNASIKKSNSSYNSFKNKKNNNYKINKNHLNKNKY